MGTFWSPSNNSGTKNPAERTENNPERSQDSEESGSLMSNSINEQHEMEMTDEFDSAEEVLTGIGSIVFQGEGK